MLERNDLFHLPFYKKEAFTGSDRGLRFWIGKVEEGDNTSLQAIVWPEPFALAHTEDEKKRKKAFPFSEEGLDLAYAWIMDEGRKSIETAELKLGEMHV